jgi:uncharacterized RDD family membrane protein YckC
MSLDIADTNGLPAPGLRRRLAAFVYEGVLLFGVVMTTALFYAGIVQQRNAMVGRSGLMAVLFVVLGLYFVWFWTHGGQTLAMKSWRMRVVCSDGGPLTAWRALARYLLSWSWFLPACIALYVWGIQDARIVFGVLLGGVVVYALTSLLHPSRQFPHDIVCGTRIVATPPEGVS